MKIVAVLIHSAGLNQCNDGILSSCNIVNQLNGIPNNTETRINTVNSEQHIKKSK